MVQKEDNQAVLSITLALLPWTSAFLFALKGPGAWRYEGDYAALQGFGGFQFVALLILVIGIIEATCIPATNLKFRVPISILACAGTVMSLIWIFFLSMM